MSWLGIDLRRMGTALLVFGIIGVIVAGLVAVGLIGGAIAARNLDERLATDQARLAQTLSRVDATMAQTVTTIGNAGTTLSTTSETLTSAGDVLGRVADTSDTLSSSLGAISILGAQPLRTAGERFAELATDARAFQEKADALATNLGTNAGDTGALADRIDELRGEVTSLQDRVASFEATGEIASLLFWGSLLLGLLAAWLATAGGACAWVGLRLRRMGTEVVEAAVEPGPGPV
jgi:methyl-accepting chemotaxis protein